MSPERRFATTVLAGLSAVVVLLAAANVATVVVDRRVRTLPEELLRVFNLNVESSLGTWLSIVLTALAGGLALLAAWGSADRRQRWGWLAVAGLLILLSVDDKVQFHERLPDYLGMERGSLATHEWLLPGIVLLGLALVVVVVLARHLPRVPRRWLLVALVVFVAGSVGAEGLSGLLVRGAEGETGTLRRLVFGLMILEESLEMLGSALAVAVILGHLRADGVLRRGPGAASERSGPRL